MSLADTDPVFRVLKNRFPEREAGDWCLDLSRERVARYLGQQDVLRAMRELLEEGTHGSLDRA